MKKLFLLVFVGILITFSCGPARYISDYTYFLTNTVEPQSVVDSLLGNELTSDYQTWQSYVTRGINGPDSTNIFTYLNWIETTDTSAIDISVITYTNSDTATVKSKIVKIE